MRFGQQRPLRGLRPRFDFQMRTLSVTSVGGQTTDLRSGGRWRNTVYGPALSRAKAAERVHLGASDVPELNGSIVPDWRIHSQPLIAARPKQVHTYIYKECLEAPCGGGALD